MEKFEEKTVLVTGGGGYIGSHCILQLLEHKFRVLAIDNFDNAVQGNLVKVVDKIILEHVSWRATLVIYC